MSTDSRQTDRRAFDRQATKKYRLQEKKVQIVDR
jgi:hypothetical protein